LEDATAIYRAVRHPADEAEISVTRKAAALARSCLDDALAAGNYTHTGALTAAIEGPARLAGAEEVIVEFATDLTANAALRRLDGDFELGERYALRLALAYKGHWIRIGHTRDDHTGDVASWLAGNLSAAVTGGGTDDIVVELVQFESCIGSSPLSVVEVLPYGATGAVNFTLNINGNTHLASVPVLNQDGAITRLD
jgi:hypothetical protein